MPHITDRPCILCGGPRDTQVAYTTKQGKRSLRWEPRCKPCNAARRAERYSREKAKELVAMAKWREANRRYTRIKAKLYQQSEHGKQVKAYHQRLRKARLRSGQGDDEAIRSIYRLAKEEEALVSKCPVFTLPELGHEFQVDHILPLAKGGLHAANNLQILPKGLNMRKGVTVRAAHY